MKKIQHDNIRSIAVTQQALNEIYQHFDEFHKTTVWQEECRSWFKDGKQKNRIYLWPGPVSAAAPLITPRSSRNPPRQLRSGCHNPCALVSLFARHASWLNHSRSKEALRLTSCNHRRSISSSRSRTLDSKTMISVGGTGTGLPSWERARSRPTRPRTSPACRLTSATTTTNGASNRKSERFHEAYACSSRSILSPLQSVYIPIVATEYPGS